MVNRKSPKVSKQEETTKSPNSKDVPVIEISDDEVPVPVPRKRGRLMKNGAFATNNVANIVSSDEENVEALSQKKMVDDDIQTDDKVELDEEAPITFSRSKKKQRTSASNAHPFTLIDEETDDEFDNISQDNDIHISDVMEDGTDDEDGIDLEDSENCSQESTYEEDDLDDFIDAEDATSDDTDDENNDDDF